MSPVRLVLSDLFVYQLLRKALGEFGDLGYFKIINLGGENHSTTGCVDFNSETEATNAIGASMSQRGIKLGRRKRLFLEPFLPIEVSVSRYHRAGIAYAVP